MERNTISCDFEETKKFLNGVSVNCGTQDVVVDPKSRRTKIYKKGVRHEDVSEDESNQKKWRGRRL